ncbi:MAG: NAD(P)/FAD-dependent oxidoreductase [Chloroflexota bacterium]
MTEKADIIIIGAGAAGLMAGIWAARTHPSRKIIALDGAKKLGAKILVAGGGRCNVTHDEVDADAFAGGSRNAIRKLLLRYDVLDTITFFRDLGVKLKREDSGKLFPVSNQAQTILDALLRAAAPVSIRTEHRVESIDHQPDGFTVSGSWGSLRASKVILAAGGMALPKSGSDGGAYAFAQALGHSLTERIFPALVPLTLPPNHFITTLPGITLYTTLEVRSASGKKLVSFTDSTLCTHFGLSGPAVLDISRYYLDAKAADPGASLVINWLPSKTVESVDRDLLALDRSSPLKYLGDLPDRLARMLCREADIEPSTRASQLSRPARQRLARTLTEMPLPITGDRGFTYAEVTAGGIPLDEIKLETMESRFCPGLHLCGEICDVDGRIGGYNFQWAWSSGYVAGISV